LLKNQIPDEMGSRQKGLHVGQKALEYTALAKGIYETGQQLYTIGRTVAPMAAALL
jgi:hypothetical protein